MIRYPKATIIKGAMVYLYIKYCYINIYIYDDKFMFILNINIFKYMKELHFSYNLTWLQNLSIQQKRRLIFYFMWHFGSKIYCRW